MKTIIEIPWPPAKLSPNARGHWRSKEKARKSYKEQCYFLALANKGTAGALLITFCPPNKRPRDLDNLLASIKYGLDGIALAWRVNDKDFKPITVDFGPPVKNGKVKITCQ